MPDKKKRHCDKCGFNWKSHYTDSPCPMCPGKKTWRPPPKAKKIKRARRSKCTLSELGFASYKDYLSSKLWFGIRMRILERDKHTCCRCGGTAAQVHHLNYCREVMQGRADEFLVSVCRGCHHFAELNEDGSKGSRSRANAILVGGKKTEAKTLQRKPRKPRQPRKPRKRDLADDPISREYVEMFSVPVVWDADRIRELAVCPFESSPAKIIEPDPPKPPAVKETIYISLNRSAYDGSMIIPSGTHAGKMLNELTDYQLRNSWRGFNGHASCQEIAAAMQYEMARRGMSDKKKRKR